MSMYFKITTASRGTVFLTITPEDGVAAYSRDLVPMALSNITEDAAELHFSLLEALDYEDAEKALGHYLPTAYDFDQWRPYPRKDR